MPALATPLTVVVWQDYVCPWAYLGRHRTGLLEALGLTVIRQPFELHPETPAAGRPVRPDGRLASLFARIGSECRDLGIAFRSPSATPNTRLALELAEVVRSHDPLAFAVLDDALFTARFVQGADLSDAAELGRILAELDLDPSLLDDATTGAGRGAVERSMARARDYGIAATPSWRFPNGFVIPGVHQPAQMQRWATRIIERSEGVGRIDDDG